MYSNIRSNSNITILERSYRIKKLTALSEIHATLFWNERFVEKYFTVTICTLTFYQMFSFVECSEWQRSRHIFGVEPGSCGGFPVMGFLAHLVNISQPTLTFFREIL